MILKSNILKGYFPICSRRKLRIYSILKGVNLKCKKPKKEQGEYMYLTQIAINKLHNLTNSFTLEGSFCGFEMSDKGAFQFTTGDLMKMGIYFGLHEYFLTVINNDDLDDANQNLSCKANRLKDEMIK
jgi:hypothetical protein